MLANIWGKQVICACVTQPAGQLQDTSMCATPKLVFAQLRVHELSVYAVKPNINQTCQKWKSRALLSTFDDVQSRGWKVLCSCSIWKVQTEATDFALKPAQHLHWQPDREVPSHPVRTAPLTRWCRIAYGSKHQGSSHQPDSHAALQNQLQGNLIVKKVCGIFLQPGFDAKWRNHLLGVLDPRNSHTAAGDIQEIMRHFGIKRGCSHKMVFNAFTYKRSLNPLRCFKHRATNDSEETALVVEQK